MHYGGKKATLFLPAPSSPPARLRIHVEFSKRVNSNACWFTLTKEFNLEHKDVPTPYVRALFGSRDETFADFYLFLFPCLISTDILAQRGELNLVISFLQMQFSRGFKWANCE